MIVGIRATAIGALKGPRHGGANLKVLEMMEYVKESVTDWKDEGQIKDVLANQPGVEVHIGANGLAAPLEIGKDLGRQPLHPLIELQQGANQGCAGENPTQGGGRRLRADLRHRPRRLHQIRP